MECSAFRTFHRRSGLPHVRRNATGVTVTPGEFQPFIATGENQFSWRRRGQHGVTLRMPADKERNLRHLPGDHPRPLNPTAGALDFVRDCRAHGGRRRCDERRPREAGWQSTRKLGCGVHLRCRVTAPRLSTRKPAPDLVPAAAIQTRRAARVYAGIEDAPQGRARRQGGRDALPGLTTSVDAAACARPGRMRRRPRSARCWVKQRLLGC